LQAPTTLTSREDISMCIYYVYAYLRNKDSETAKAGTPYYIGKGVNNRAWEQHRRKGKGVHTPKDKSLIVILSENLTDRESKDLEIELIAKHGRKDLGTGILENRTNGGEGTSGWIVTEETRAKKAKSMLGKNVGKTRDAEFRAKISEFQSGRPKPPRTEEHKQNSRKPKSEKHKQNLRKPKSTTTCPHCGKLGGSNGMKRYHFDNCKSVMQD